MGGGRIIIIKTHWNLHSGPALGCISHQNTCVIQPQFCRPLGICVLFVLLLFLFGWIVFWLMTYNFRYKFSRWKLLHVAYNVIATLAPPLSFPKPSLKHFSSESDFELSSSARLTMTTSFRGTRAGMVGSARTLVKDIKELWKVISEKFPSAWLKK